MQKIPQWTSGDQFREGVNEGGAHVCLGFFIYVNMYMSHIFHLMPEFVASQETKDKHLYYKVLY